MLIPKIEYKSHKTFDEFKKEYGDFFKFSNVEMKEAKMKEMYEKVNPPVPGGKEVRKKVGN